jgi:hypothetical protein
VIALARLPLARLLRTPRSWIPIVLWTLVAMVSALLVKSRGLTTGADHVLRGSFGFLVLPLVSYGVVSAVLGGVGMKRSIKSVVVLGAAPRRAALASTLVSVVVAIILGALLSVLVCALAHGSGDPPLGRDLFASFWIGALGGGAYAAWFCAGSAIGKGAMRGGFLVIDWILGSGTGFGAALVPRGHVHSLLGGASVAELPSRASSVVLFVLLLLYIGLAVLLSRRAV